MKDYRAAKYIRMSRRKFTIQDLTLLFLEISSLRGLRYLATAHILLLIWTGPCYADDADINSIPSSPKKLFFIDYGISATQQSLDVYSVDSINPLGTLTSNMYIYPRFNIGINDIYFKNSNFGYYFVFRALPFRMKKQELNNLKEVNLGTSASGYFLNITPVFFYHYGARTYKNVSDRSFKIGAGIGIGYLRAKGDIILTNTTPQQYHKFNIKSDGTSLGGGVMMEYRWGEWLLRAYGGGPSVTEGPYEYDLFDFSMYFGHITEF